MKLYLYLTQPEEYLKHGECRFVAYDNQNSMPNHWVFAGEVELDPIFDDKKMRQHAINEIDKRIQTLNAETQVRITDLESRKQNLLCLDYVPTE